MKDSENSNCNKTLKVYPFTQFITDWGWHHVYFKDCLNRPCYIAEDTGHDKDYYSEIIGSQYLLLGLNNDECPMQLNREMAKSLVFYLQNWLKGRLHENRRE